MMKRLTLLFFILSTYLFGQGFPGPRYSVMWLDTMYARGDSIRLMSPLAVRRDASFGKNVYVYGTIGSLEYNTDPYATWGVVGFNTMSWRARFDSLYSFYGGDSIKVFDWLSLRQDTRFESGKQFYSNTDTLATKAYARSLSSGPENVFEVAKSGKKYTTIQSAISAATYGSIVLVYPGTYAGNVTIADSGITVVGLNPYSTIVTGTFTVTAKKTRIEGLRFDSTFTHNSQYLYSLHEWNQYERCIFASDVFLGTATMENIYGYDFFECNFVGYSDTLYVNQTGNWQAHTVIRGGYMMSEEAFDTYGKGYNLVLKSGAYLRFKGCSDLSFESIYYDCADSTIVLEFDKCRTVLIGSGTFTAVNNGTNFAVLSMNYGLIGNWGHSTAWTFSGRFEVDFRWVSLTIPDIIWNSTAQSRWEWCEQRPFGSTATLTGTGLNKLHISNSIFKMDAPSGLATNRGNGWVQWIDN